MENNQTRIKIYTKDPCPYCVRAINLMNAREIPFEEVDLTDQPEEILRLKRETGWATVPIILLDGELIGGYTDLKALSDSGELDQKLASSASSSSADAKKGTQD